MDAFARGLKTAAAIRADGGLENALNERYETWGSALGSEIEAGKHSFASLETLMLKQGDAMVQRSGRQEFLENYINRFI
jgi:xylose isomerase